jgi:hypothetical protein
LNRADKPALRFYWQDKSIQYAAHRFINNDNYIGEFLLRPHGETGVSLS